MTLPDKSASTSVEFKVFVKGKNGRWRVASVNASPREAQWTADLLITRQGFLARVPR